MSNRQLTLAPKNLSPGDLLRVASVGLRTRRLRAALSSLGIAIGVAAIVAVLGLSSSSSAAVIAEIGQLGTNLLKVTNGQTDFGKTAELPYAAPARIARIGPVTETQYTGTTSASAYRTPLIPSVNTNGLGVVASSLHIPKALGTTLFAGSYLTAADSHLPVCVLGAQAAQHLGIDRIIPGERIWVGNQWFYVVGILNPSVLAPEIDSDVLVGFPAAVKYLGFDGHPGTIYVRTNPDYVSAVDAVLAAAANPENPSNVDVSQTSAALQAEADTKNAFSDLFLGLGAVALLVGAVGVANIMVISVLERRSEIGLRRSLGATKGHIRMQFLSEAILLSILGGAVGVGAGTLATVIYASVKGWMVDVPPLAWAGGFAAALVIGAVAGLLPALRAARLSPTDALRTV